MKIHTLSVGPFQSNCFIVTRDSETGAPQPALVIDPGSDPDAISRLLSRHRLVPAVYLLTHGHMDHLSALAAIHSIHPAPVAIHPADYRWAFTAENSMPPFYPTPTSPQSFEHRPLAHGQSFTDAGLTYSVIETPGHTPGSVCFHFPSDPALFSGDTLFAGGGVGRTDLNGGSSRALAESLRRLAELPDNTRVYCGHGPDTDMGSEKRVNYFMQRHAR